jgi:hypothetical protein
MAQTTLIFREHEAKINLRATQGGEWTLRQTPAADQCADHYLASVDHHAFSRSLPFFRLLARITAPMRTLPTIVNVAGSGVGVARKS